MKNNNNNEKKEFNPKLKNTAKLNWQSKPKIEPEPKDLEFQNAEIVYPNVELKHGKLSHFIEDATESNKVEEQPNKLIWGDNLLVMQALLAQGYEGKIDLIYIDPPFNTGENFNFTNQVVLSKGEKIEKDWTMIERLAYTDTWERGMDSFLDMMYLRLKLMYRLLSDNGLLFIHLDYNASHYIKIICDEVFKGNFRNEIIVKRIKKNVKEKEEVKKLNVYTDSVLVYAKNSTALLNIPRKPEKREERWHSFEASGYRTGMDYPLFGHKPHEGNHWRWSKERAEQAIQGRILRPHPKTNKPEYLIGASETTNCDNLWDDITAYTFDYDYPTEKSTKLLSRIFEMYPSKNFLFADFFCGSGTSIEIAETNKIKWIGSDLSKTSIHVTRNRLIDISSQIKTEPFMIQNLGSYQRHLIYTQGFNIKKANSLIFKLYKSKQREDLIDIGIKEDEKNALVFVSYPDRHLTAKTVVEKTKEIEDLDGGIYKKLIVLAWDYEIQFDENLKKLSELDEYKTKIQIETKLIPADVYSYLKKIDESKEDEINKLRDRVHFYDKPYLKLSKPKIVQNFGSEALIRLEIERYNILDFPIKDEDKKSKLLEACKNNFAILIDYYSVDWDYDKELFKSQTQVMAGFGKKRQIVNTIVENRLKKGKKYNIVVRLVDIFGNDSEARTEIDLR